MMRRKANLLLVDSLVCTLSGMTRSKLSILTVDMRGFQSCERRSYLGIASSQTPYRLRIERSPLRDLLAHPELTRLTADIVQSQHDRSHSTLVGRLSSSTLGHIRIHISRTARID